MVLKAEPHDWKSSALTARSLVKSWHWIWPKYDQQFWPKCFRKMTKCEDLYEAVLNNCLFHQYAVYLIFNFQVENLLGTMVSQLTKIWSVCILCISLCVFCVLFISSFLDAFFYFFCEIVFLIYLFVINCECSCLDSALCREQSRSVVSECRSSHPEMLCKKGVIRNFAKFTRKHLYQSLFFNKVAGLGLQLY